MAVSSPERPGVPSASKWLLVGGVLFLLCIIATFAFSVELPDPDAPFEEFQSTYADNRDDLVLTGIFFSVGMLGFLGFQAALFSSARSAGDNSAVPVLAVASAAAAVAVMTAGFSLQSGAARGAEFGVDADTVRGLDEMGHMTLHAASLPLALAVGAAAVAVFRAGLVPTWLAITGGVIALLVFLDVYSPAETDTPLHDLALLGTVLIALWSAGTSMLLLVRRPRT